MGGGDFSLEAYEQLRQAYADQQQNQVDQELAGKQLMGQDYGLETRPVDSPWADKIEKWTYPDGKSPYMDDKQSPDEILQIMRDSAQERIDAKTGEVSEEDSDDVDIESMSDEEFDAYIANLLIDEDEEEEDESEEETTEDEEEEDEDEDEEDTEEEQPEVEEDESDDEEEEEPEEEDTEEVESEEDAYDPDDVAAQIAELRAELEGMQFVAESQQEEESNDDESN